MAHSLADLGGISEVSLLLDTLAEFKAYIKDELQEAGALRDGLLMSDVVSQSKDGPLQWVDIVLAGACWWSHHAFVHVTCTCSRCTWSVL
jgi:hypothetical protein